MEKKITIKDFVKKYNAFASDQSKENFVKKHILKKYVPYEDKCDLCKRIVSSSMKIISDGKNIFNQNTPARFMIYCLRMVDLYTDISVDHENSLNEYNVLDEYNLFDVILNNIPQDEKSKVDTILKMTLDDFYQNDRSILSFIERYMEKQNYAYQSIIDNLDNMIKK